MTAKKKDESGEVELTESQEAEYTRYMDQHRFTRNAMTREQWLEMTKVAEKKDERRAG